MIHRLNAALALALVAGTLAGWPLLPERIPVHFDLAGRPDRWADRSLLAWFGPALGGLLSAGGLYAFGRWIPTRPKWINLPDKERYLALSPEERRPVNEAIASILHVTATVVLVVFALVQAMVFRQALGESSTGLTMAVLVVSVGSGPVVAAFGLLRIQRRLDEAWKRRRARGGDASAG